MKECFIFLAQRGQTLLCTRNTQKKSFLYLNRKSNIIELMNNFESNVLSVTALTNLIKDLLENNIQNIILEGEISNYKPSSSGHVYFTLKDENAAISACLFKGSKARLTFEPKDGMKVRVFGSISVYPPRGSYQIIVNKMEIAGISEILARLEELKQRLYAEGLFAEDKKKPIPMFPSTIGIVTSPTGAAVHDILQIMKRRNPCVNAIVFPCAVQGEDAAQQIAEQIKTANKTKLVDVLIVGRGGGSLEDLLAFSDECVVRAIADSAIPVVSAVGHEVDWAISDFVADKRASTPSAAAELCTPLYSEIINAINFYKSEITTALTNKTANCRLLIKSFSLETLEMSFRSIEQPYLIRFDNAKEEVLTAIKDKLKELHNQIKNSLLQIESSDPMLILAKGYSIVKDKKTGKVIKSNEDIEPGTLLEITPEKGVITAQVV